MNDWQEEIRHIIRVNNIAIERFHRWLAQAEREGDATLEMIAKERIAERKLANEDLQGILEEYGDEREE